MHLIHACKSTILAFLCSRGIIYLMGGECEETNPCNCPTGEIQRRRKALDGLSLWRIKIPSPFQVWKPLSLSGCHWAPKIRYLGAGQMSPLVGG